MMADKDDVDSVQIHLPSRRDFLIAISGCVAVLCWWIGITAFVSTGGTAGGAVFFLIPPVLATMGTLFAARSRKITASGGSNRSGLRMTSNRPASGRHRKDHALVRPEHRHARISVGHPWLNHPATQDCMVIVSGFVALLCWWIGIIAFVSTGGTTGAAVFFLTAPVLATVGTLLALRHRKNSILRA
jgi:hypothetical protein